MAVDLVYNNARAQFAAGAWAWTSLPVYFALVDGNYTPSAANDVHLSDIPSASLLLSGIELTGLGVRSNGVVYGTIPQQNALLLPGTVAAGVLYVLGISESQSPLIYYSASGVGFPFTADGENYNIGYDQLAGGFFQV
jgi:hypothetical protein